MLATMDPYGPYPPDSAPLRAIARRKIESKALPCASGVQLCAERGGGESCSVCEREIIPSHILYEIEFAEAPVLRVHLACHAAWQLECQAVRDEATWPDAGPHN